MISIQLPRYVLILWNALSMDGYIWNLGKGLFDVEQKGIFLSDVHIEMQELNSWDCVDVEVDNSEIESSSSDSSSIDVTIWHIFFVQNYHLNQHILDAFAVDG